MTKRLNGEGYIRKRTDGRWETQLTVDGRRVSIYGKSAEDVAAKRDSARGRIERREPVTDSTRNLGGYLEYWITDVLAHSDRKPSTISQQTGLLRKHVIPALGHKPIGKVLPGDISAMLARMKTAGLSASTRKSTFLALRVALANAVKPDKLIATNPAAELKTPEVDRVEADYLTPEQSRLLLANLDGLRYGSAIRLLLSTGMRRGEVAALKWTDVDLANGRLRVRRTVNRVDGELVTSTPKTKQARRTVPLDPSTVAMLRTHKAAQAAEQLAAGDLWEDSGLVFATEHGGQPDPASAMLRTVKLAAKRAGIVATAHALRHAAGSAMVDAGHSLPVVRDILGHSSVAITGDVYSHVVEASARAAVDGWADQLGGG